MNKDDMPQIHQDYVTEYKDRTFVEIRKFMDESLRKLKKGEAVSTLPDTEEDFLALHNLLIEKIVEEKSKIQWPELPDNPEVRTHPGYFYEPSDKLKRLHSLRENLGLDLSESLNERTSSSQNRSKNLRAQIKDLDFEIGEREKYERRQFEAAYFEYQDSLSERDRIEALRQQLTAQPNAEYELVKKHEKIAGRVLRDINSFFKNRSILQVETVHWKLLPGDVSTDSIYRYYTGESRKIAKKSGLEIDLSRLNKIMSLEPDWAYEERFSSDMSDYLIYTFPYTEKAIMECPVVGNALYIIRAGWKDWSGKSKKALQEDKTGLIVRITHQKKDWFKEVENELLS